MNKKIFNLLLIIILLISIGFNIYYFLLKNNTNNIVNTGNNNITKSYTGNNNIVKNNNSQNVNFIFEILDSFKKVKNVNDFKNFKNKYGQEAIMILALKSKNIELWDKYWGLKYDYYISIQDKYFLKDIDNGLIKSRNDFINQLHYQFFKILDGLNPQSNKELEMDINLYFNSLGIKKSLENCDYIRKRFPTKYEGDVFSCEDKIYFYRATKQNKYCDKISDLYKKRICKDFLDYQENKK